MRQPRLIRGALPPQKALHALPGAPGDGLCLAAAELPAAGPAARPGGGRSPERLDVHRASAPKELGFKVEGHRGAQRAQAKWPLESRSHGVRYLKRTSGLQELLF